MKKIGQNIRKLRELKTLTQQYMADKLEMTQGNYARIENEEINISEERLKKIASLLGCNPEFIVQFDVSKIYNTFQDHNYAENNGMHQFKISPELKELYEGRINTLESLVSELKKELVLLKDQALKQTV